MKPSYLFEKDVPQEVRDKVKDEVDKDKERALEKFIIREVMMEQELATSEEPLKIKDLLKLKAEEGMGEIKIKEWALFNIGAWLYIKTSSHYKELIITS